VALEVAAVKIAQPEPSKNGEDVEVEVLPVRLKRARLDLRLELGQPARRILVKRDVAVDDSRRRLA
jgi:hypothetical protein